MSPVSPVPAEERQVNLLLALRHSGRGLTKAEVLATVAGYDPGSGASAHRMFERDKDTLRNLGITITSVPVGATGSGTQVRYRIDDADYTLPDVHLTAAQAAALEVAGRAWRSGSLPAAARRALTKLRAVTEGPDSEPGPTPDLTLDLGEDLPEVLVAAVDERRVVVFDYRSARSGSLARRTVEPYALRRADGAWYLDGWDRDAGGVRTFRLARVVGEVRAVGAADAFQVPADLEPAGVRAVLAVLPGRALALRARAVDTAPERLPQVPGRDVMVVESDDVMAFAGALAAAGEAVVVLEPAGLRQEVLDHLTGAQDLARPEAPWPG